MPDLTPGTEFAGHLIEAEVKRGGMGVVYRATDLRLQRPVALKVITPVLSREADFRTRFEREWSLAASIDHPNVIPVYHTGEEEGTLYTTMLWVEGPDLGDMVAEEGRLSLQGASDIASQVAAGLHAAHAHGLIHRDVKPANILLRPYGKGSYHAYLSDFGLTRRVDGATALTMAGMFVGTVAYVAPEQLLGAQIDARADIYSLGCVLFHALAGHPPYRGKSDWETLKAHETGEIPSLLAQRPDLPAGIDAVIARALAKSPEDRYPSAGDLARALEATIAGQDGALPEASVAKGDAATGETKLAHPDETRLAPLPPTEPGETKLADPGETRLAPVAKLAGPGETKLGAPPSEKPTDARKKWGLLVGAVLLLVAGLAISGAFGGGGDKPSPNTVVLGTTALTPPPACPRNCQAIGNVTGFQVKTGNTPNLFQVPADGTISAWTLTLARPAGNQRSFFNDLYGGPPEARLAVVRPIPGPKPPRFELLAQGPIQVLSRYLGQTAKFSSALPVSKGDIIALSVPTWAPAFATGLSSGNSWRGSRPTGECVDEQGTGGPGGKAQQRKGGHVIYGCFYTKARLLYTATLVAASG